MDWKPLRCPVPALSARQPPSKEQTRRAMRSELGIAPGPLRRAARREQGLMLMLKQRHPDAAYAAFFVTRRSAKTLTHLPCNVGETSVKNQAINMHSCATLGC